MIGSVERNVMRINRGEVNEARETPGWDKTRIQIDSGAIDSVGPKVIARAFEMRETATNKRGIGYVAAHGSGVKNYGENKFVGRTEDGEGVSLRTQRGGVKEGAGVGS